MLVGERVENANLLTHQPEITINYHIKIVSHVFWLPFTNFCRLCMLVCFPGEVCLVFFQEEGSGKWLDFCYGEGLTDFHSKSTITLNQTKQLGEWSRVYNAELHSLKRCFQFMLNLIYQLHEWFVQEYLPTGSLVHPIKTILSIQTY